MYFRRRYFRRRPRYRRKGWVSKARGWRRPTRIEVKLVDIAMDADITPNGFGNPVYTLLNGLKPGSGFYNRLGSRVSMKSVFIKVEWAANVNVGAAAQPQNPVRLSLVYDKLANAAAPTVAQIWSVYDQNGSGTSGFDAPINPLFRDRFIVLFDKMFNSGPCEAIALSGGATGTILQQWVANMPNRYLLQKYVKLRGLETLYNTGTAGTIADIQAGSLYLISQQPNTATSCAFKMYFTGRLRWTD